MQFKKVRALIEHSMTSTTAVVVFEHEIPILQVRFGSGKVTSLPPTKACGTAMVDELTGQRDEYGEVVYKKVPLERTLEEEWSRLMESPAMVQTNENTRMAAPLVAFPRGVLDLEDFYVRLNRNRPVEETVELEPSKPEEPDAVEDKPKTERELIREQLDMMGVEYKGNAKTSDLKALLAEINDGGTDLQDEG